MATLIPAIASLLTALGALAAAVAAKTKADAAHERVKAHIRDCHPGTSTMPGQ